MYSLAVVALEVRVRFQISDGIKFTQANKSNVFTTSFCVPKLSSTSRQVTIEFTRLGAQTIKFRGCIIRNITFPFFAEFFRELDNLGTPYSGRDWRLPIEWMSWWFLRSNGCLNRVKLLSFACMSNLYTFDHWRFFRVAADFFPLSDQIGCD